MEENTELDLADNETFIITMADAPPQLNLEKAMDKSGGWTKWHMIIFNVINMFVLMYAFMQLNADTFFELMPAEVHCRLPPNISTNGSIPTVHEPITGEEVLSKCYVYQDYDVSTNTTIRCPDGWFYSEEVYTIVNQFGLVCHQEHWMELLHLVLSTASPALTVILSGLADHLGRKAILLFSVTMSILGSVIDYFSPDVVAYIVLRCLTHGFILTAIVTAFVFLCEVFRTSNRPTAVVLTNIYWTLGQGILLLIASLIPHWSNILLIISCPFVLILLFCRFIPETPHWFLTKEKILETKTMLRNITHFNKKSIPQMLLYSEQERERIIRNCKTKTRGCTKYFCCGECSQGTYNVNREPKDPKRKKIFHTKYWKFIIYFAFFICMFFTLNVMRELMISMTAERFDSVYLHFLFVMGTEAPSFILCLLLLKYVRRRGVMCCLFAMCGVSLLTLLGVTYLAKNTDAFIRGSELVLEVISLFFCRAAFITCVLICCEVFPTSVRCLALGFILFAWKTGCLVISHVDGLVHVYDRLPLVLIGVTSLLLSALCWLLPETKCRPLQENFGQTVMLKDKDKKSLRKFAKIGAENKRQKKNMAKNLKRFGGD